MRERSATRAGARRAAPITARSAASSCGGVRVTVSKSCRVEGCSAIAVAVEAGDLVEEVPAVPDADAGAAASAAGAASQSSPGAAQTGPRAASAEAKGLGGTHGRVAEGDEGQGG